MNLYHILSSRQNCSITNHACIYAVGAYHTRLLTPSGRSCDNFVHFSYQQLKPCTYATHGRMWSPISKSISMDRQEHLGSVRAPGTGGPVVIVR